MPTRDLLELTNTAGDLRRAGEWLVPPRVVVRSWFGNARLDMRRARFVTGEVVIDVDIVIGNIDVRLPPGASVDITGVRTAVGTVRDRVGESVSRGTPHVILVGGTQVGNVTAR